MEYNFPVIRTTHPKPRPADETKLGFAKYFTDHMFVMDYDEGQGWHDGRVVPHEPFLIEPASCVLHYAQMMFEGMKAYRTPDGGVQIFRPDMNIKRMARTNERMCIPELPGDLFLAAVKAVIEADRDWIPSAPGTAMYIRPFIFGDEVSFSVLPAKHYKFMIILSPTAPTTRQTTVAWPRRASMCRTNTSARRTVARAMPRSAATTAAACAPVRTR